MKNFLFFIPIAFLWLSCSNAELSEKKALSLIENCSDLHHNSKTIAFTIGKINFSKHSKDFKEKYLTLQKEGLITISEKPSFSSVVLTPKGKTFLAHDKQVDELRAFITKNNQVNVITSYYNVNQINEIQIVPETNVALVKASFKLSKKTPFFSFQKNTSEIIDAKNLEFHKISDKWTYTKCKS